MTAHPNAHILAQLAEIAKTDPEPWKRLEVQDMYGSWVKCGSQIAILNPDVILRIRPATRERPSSITLTTLEIADLAKFAGLLCGLPNRESQEDQVTIEPCPEDGLRDDDEGEIWSSSWIAYMTEYPEEGSVTLGNTIRAGAKETSDADKT